MSTLVPRTTGPAIMNAQTSDPTIMSTQAPRFAIPNTQTPVSGIMNAQTLGPTTPPPLTQAVTETVMKGIKDNGDPAALIGGIIGAVLLLIICIIAVLLWCLSRHKGSYVTNEMDDDDDDIENNGNESDASDTALQIKEPLETTEEE